MGQRKARQALHLTNPIASLLLIQRCIQASVVLTQMPATG